MYLYEVSLSLYCITFIYEFLFNSKKMLRQFNDRGEQQFA